MSIASDPLPTELAIRVRGLGKRYRLGALQPYRTLRDEIARRFSGNQPRAAENVETRELWALQDMDLDVASGEVLGIVGRNGAGKSTLLRILTRITRPTCGNVMIRGRVGALLEVGTGFHLELTGRENVYLNGSILGMSRAEIDRKFDQIVDFSGVERFLDTPVKRYSSGMRVRLAFAVAAHLEPEVLIVDEVLAVGDASFQRKCLGRMNQVATEGRTVLFVSHQLELLANLCTRAIRMDEGRVVDDGRPDDVIAGYLLSLQDTIREGAIADRSDRSGDGFLRVTAIDLTRGDGTSVREVKSGDAVEFRLAYRVVGPGARRDIEVRLNILDHLRRPLTRLWSGKREAEISTENPDGVFTCRIARLPLPPGDYVIGFGVICGGERVDKINDAWGFSVAPGDFFGNGLPVAGMGLVLCEHQWELQ